MSERVLALIHYYAREGLHRQVQNVCNEVLKTRANDSTLVFWRAACGLLPEGNTSEVRKRQTDPQHSETMARPEFPECAPNQK